MTFGGGKNRSKKKKTLPCVQWKWKNRDLWIKGNYFWRHLIFHWSMIIARKGNILCSSGTMMFRITGKKSSPMSRIYVTECLRHVAQRTLPPVPYQCYPWFAIGSSHWQPSSSSGAASNKKHGGFSDSKCEIREIPLWLRTGVWPTTLLLHSSYNRRADFSIDKLLQRKRSTRELSIWFLMFRCWSQPWKPTVTSGVKDLVASQISWNIRPYQNKSYPFCRVDSTNSSAVCRTHFCQYKKGQVSISLWRLSFNIFEGGDTIFPQTPSFFWAIHSSNFDGGVTSTCLPRTSNNQ